MNTSYCNYTSIIIVIIVIVKLVVVLIISNYMYINDANILHQSIYLDIWKDRPLLIRNKIHHTTENALKFNSLSTIHTHHYLIYEENIEVSNIYFIIYLCYI